MRKSFAQYIKKLDKGNISFKVLLGDISVGLFIDENDQLNNNVMNMGILEQSMISFGAGLSREGILTFIHTISPFMIERAYEQIKLELVYNKNKCILVSANGPYDYNKLGPTHHCASDVPLMCILGDIDIYLPGTADDVSKCLDLAIKNANSSYIRLTSIHPENSKLINGQLSRKGSNKLNVFIGEALMHYESCANFKNEDALYIYRFEDIIDDLNSYSAIEFWEPYCEPILASKYKVKSPKNQRIYSNIYPRSIQNGIYDLPVQFTTTQV